MSHWRKLLVLSLVVSFYCPLHDLTQAAPGDSDPVFGTETIVSTNFFDGGGLIQAVALLPGEKILAGGSVGTSNQGFNVDFALARYRADGSLDSSFGTGGKQTTEFSGYQDTATGMAIQPDGKIVLAGASRSADGADNSDFALARYNSDGSLDTTFGAGGKVTTNISGLYDYASAVALQSDGKIIAAGESVSSVVSGALVRYNPDGSLDSSFGSGGKLIIQSVINISTIAIQPNGKIVAAGYFITTSPKINDDFVVLRYNPDGSLDTAFGTGGKTVTDFFGLDDFVASCALSPDGKIILAGRATRNNPISEGDSDFGLVRYNENGSLDLSFGNGGKVVTDFPSLRDQATRITLQPDGKIVAVGEYLATTPSTTSRLGLARYNSDGSLDSTFGTAGKVTTSLESGSSTITVTIEGSSKIIVGGAGGFTLVRYNPDGSRDTNFHSRGTTTTDFFNHGDSAQAVAVQDDGKIIAAGIVQNQGGEPMFALTRYNPDGNLDSSFGAGGKVTDKFGNIIFALLILPDGRIIAGGRSSSDKFGLMRFNADGSSDKTFGKRGKVETRILGIDEIRALALQPDGRIIAVGRGRPSSFPGSEYNIVIARYNKDGDLDSSFGDEGKVISRKDAGVIDLAWATGLQSDGKIVVAGSTQNINSSSSRSIVVVRHNFDGSRDNSFGNASRVTSAITGFSSEAHALVIQPDGKIVVAGYDLNATRAEDFALLRYDQGGNLDTGFGAGGIVTTDFFGRSDVINGLALAAGGRIIAAGSSDNKARHFALAVYKTDGGLDPGFGTNGKVTTSFGTDDMGNAVAIGPDGNITVAGLGSFFDIRGQDFAIARYEGFPGSASPAFNLCLQDETTGDVLKLNSQTGNYEFTKCGAQGITLTGKAKLKLKKSGCLIKLSNVLNDREVTASINVCRKSGSASVRIPATGQTFTITDNDMNDNRCDCP